MAEERRIQEEAEAKRLAEEKLKQEAEAMRLAEEKRMQEEAESKRLAEEKQKLAAQKRAETRKRKAETKRLAEEKLKQEIEVNYEDEENSQKLNESNELHIPEGTKILAELPVPNNSDENWRLNITSIFLPKSLRDIYFELILDEELPNLKKIVIPNGKFDKFANMLPDDWWRMYYEDGSFVCPEITIPQEDLKALHYGITNITRKWNLKGHVLIPPTCTSISKEAFRFNKKVLSITMTDSVTSIGKDAFYGCENLSFIRLSNNLKEIPASMLDGCNSLQEITVPEGVASIGKAAFCSCKSLKTIYLPSTVNTIDKGGVFSFNPFQLCPSLQQIIVPVGTKGKYQILLDGFSGNPARLLKEATKRQKRRK